MAPERVELDGGPLTLEEEEAERERVMKRFEQIGLQIMRRAGGGGPFEQDPLAAVMADKDKRALAAQLLGQAYLRAHRLIEANREGVEHIADVLVDRRELHGDEVLELLESVRLHEPQVDYRDDSAWPRI
jgi:hypothetical protein